MNNRLSFGKSKKKKEESEDCEQIKVSVYLGKRGILHFAVPNQGKRSYLYACKLKRMGVKAGVQDLIIVEARGQYHGCALELKREKGGIATYNQLYWKEAMTKKGWLALICHGADEAINEIEKYLALGDFGV